MNDPNRKPEKLQKKIKEMLHDRLGSTYHNCVKLVGTIKWLMQPKPFSQVNLHLEGVDVRKWLLSPRQHLPQCDSPRPNVSGTTELPT